MSRKMDINVKKILIHLAEKDLTQADLAARCGISRQTLSSLIRRETCTAKVAGKLATGMDVSVSEIIKESL